MEDKFDEAIRLIDEANSQDPNMEWYQGEEIPKELLYSYRMTACLNDLVPNASEELKIVARAQHIERWKIPRDTFPKTRVGYLQWRNELKKRHAFVASEILTEVGYSEVFINRVAFLIQKKKIKTDPETQALEDVICLVFLQYYFEEFSEKHPEDKIVDIIQKTWLKMSNKGQEAALKLPLTEASKTLIEKALS